MKPDEKPDAREVIKQDAREVARQDAVTMAALLDQIAARDAKLAPRIELASKTRDVIGTTSAGDKIDVGAPLYHVTRACKALWVQHGCPWTGDRFASYAEDMISELRGHGIKLAYSGGGPLWVRGWARSRDRLLKLLVALAVRDAVSPDGSIIGGIVLPSSLSDLIGGAREITLG